MAHLTSCTTLCSRFKCLLTQSIARTPVWHTCRELQWPARQLSLHVRYDCSNVQSTAARCVHVHTGFQCQEQSPSYSAAMKVQHAQCKCYPAEGLWYQAAGTRHSSFGTHAHPHPSSRQCSYQAKCTPCQHHTTGWWLGHQAVTSSSMTFASGCQSHDILATMLCSKVFEIG